MTSKKGGGGGKRSGDFTREGIKKLAADKPVAYELLSNRGKNLYTGSAKRGRVRERLEEHLRGGPDPVRGAAKVRLIQKPSIKEAQKSELSIIKRGKPPGNKRGK